MNGLYAGKFEHRNIMTKKTLNEVKAFALFVRQQFTILCRFNDQFKYYSEFENTFSLCSYLFPLKCGIIQGKI